MSTAMSTRIAAGVTAAYLRDLAGRSAPTTPEARRAAGPPCPEPLRRPASVRTRDTGSRLGLSQRDRGRLAA